METSKSKEQVAEFYEEFQSRGKYDYFYGDERRKNLYINLIGTGKRILEVGCRSGNLTQYYYSKNDVVGVDVDRNALLEFENRLGLKSEWVDIDSEELPFSDNKFDTVVLSEVMEHLRFPQKALCEIARVLTRNGTLIGSVPNAFRMRNRLKFLLGKPFESDPSHLRSYSDKTLTEELNKVFEKIQIHPISGHLIGGGSSGVPVFEWLPYSIRNLFSLDLVFEARKLHRSCR